MKAFVGTVLVSVSALYGSAYAQTAPAAADRPAATATTNSNTPMMQKGNWRASKLIGLKVYNEANERLGDINELILDSGGKVNAVIIGIGGFLGMGEHDISVSMDKLQFREKEVGHTSSTAATTASNEREAKTGATTTPAKTGVPIAHSPDVNDWAPNHAVMSGTKDQLKAMPQFKYSDVK